MDVAPYGKRRSLSRHGSYLSQQDYGPTLDDKLYRMKLGGSQTALSAMAGELGGNENSL